MAAEPSPYVRSYNSFSGTDIKAVFGNQVVGELQAISFSITREKGPIYTMGSPNPRAFSRGKRGIAGTMVMIMFDTPALLQAVKRMGLKFFADSDEIVPGDGSFTGGEPLNFDEINLRYAGLGNEVSTTDFPALGSLSQTIGTEATKTAGVGTSGDYRQPWYADQVPPFDITLAGANEYGAIAVMKIWSVEILNEGYGVSIDDIVSEEQMTYVARDITKWIVVEQPDPSKLVGTVSS